MSKVSRLREMREASYEAGAKVRLEPLPQPNNEWLQKAIDDMNAEIKKAFDPIREMAAKGGSSKSPSKQAASRANGKKGGKPKQNPSA